MEKATMRMQDFHILSDEDEIDFIKSKLFIKRMNIFLKRMIIIFILCAIIYYLQYSARKALPHLFRKEDGLDSLWHKVEMIFCGTNILSFIQLTVMDMFAFEKERTEVSVVRVLKKIKVERLELLLNVNRYLICIEAPEIGVNEEGFTIDKSLLNHETIVIEDGIYVSSRLNFSQIKEGQYVFIKRKKYDGVYKYYYLV